MNERIKLLAMQADTWCDLNVAQGSPAYNNQWEYKFAELIVRECASMARVYRSHEFDFTGDLELDEFMLKHFGVEE